MPEEPGEFLWAWFREGENSFMAELIVDQWFPFVFAREAAAKKCAPLAHEAAQATGHKAVCRKYRFIEEDFNDA